MKIIILSFLYLYSFNSLALKSPFASSIKGIELPNSHFLDQDKQLIRSMAPNRYIDDVLKLGVTDILIFKNQTRNEVDKEITLLEEVGFDNISVIPFGWHDYGNYKKACLQTIEALKIMRAVAASKRKKLLFHCTVGEDRTGYLSALWKLIFTKMTPKEAFQTQMCQKGYGRGNPKKPYKVVKEIQDDLTPLFIHMVELIKAKKIRYNYLSKKVCSNIKVNKNIKVPRCRKQLLK